MTLPACCPPGRVSGQNEVVGTVLGCWRYPVKSAAHEAAGQLTVTGEGVLGDRRWAVMDEDGTVVSAKHPARGGRLLAVTAAYDDETGAVTVTVPGHAAHRAGSPGANTALSQWLGRRVRLTDTVTGGLRLHRLYPQDAGMVPDWHPDARTGQEAVTDVTGAAWGRFVDYGPVHLVTAGALARLEHEGGRPVQPLRFRPNLLLGLPGDPAPGSVLQAGEVILRVDLPTPRCIIPSLPHPGAAEPDPGLLSVLARHHRQPIPGRGRAAVLGCYANVEKPGRIAVGDEIRVPGRRD
jgi:uncharacterized protein YcbX